MEDRAALSALDIARLIRERELSPIEVVETSLARIEKVNPELNAFVTVVADQALEQAREAERSAAERDDLPPFHGVPLPVKDLAETAGIRTTFSTKAYADYVPETDTNAVARLKRAGFIILGKTNTPEFGTVPVTESDLNGVCRNPWDPTRTPGGSSGGSAVAVAAGIAPVAHGSDGGGSIRIPASCCGIFGIKPARGRISLGPRLGEAVEGFSTDGPLARDVRDAAAMLDVLEGYETGEPYWAPPPERPYVEEVGADPGKLRIALTLQTQTNVEVDAECATAARDAAALLESLGHSVEEADPGWYDDDAMGDWVKVWQTLPAPFLIDDPAELEPLNGAFLQAAKATNTIDYARSVIGVHRLAREVVAFWDDYDLVLTPTLCKPPVPVGWVFEEDDPWAQFIRLGEWVGFTALMNATGQPAVSLPLHWTEDGLPVGVQLIAAPAREDVLFRVSGQVEEAAPWSHRYPPL